ncbi:cation:proton antiporter domain-containing protein [Auraticoccus monumenti]|uniref:NhaP-type Na+/H+ or K+/H+ antiporter n=1 Tax=Auraticoccus monumenti TaxID=675864 RepID=A0A1G7BTU1_9ACTN|nr:cation:proton antiporter [Auraticoccus monumenti]SDE30554.1 NhaP-type Na+/H+ or K+/H+ antiporter [Auraticoccus monumenti]
MTINLVLTLFAGTTLVLSLFSRLLQRVSLPGPLLALAAGALIGPYALDLIRVEDLGVPAGTLLEQASRVTLAVGLAGVAMRLPHGYWRSSTRWLGLIIGVGMVTMLAVATGVLWALLGVPFLVALLLGAIITPTDPVVTTPVVTGSLAEERVPERVRHDLSAESGINDGLGYLFVLLPVLLLTRPDTAWHDLVTTVLLREVLGAALLGAVAGYLLGRLFALAEHKGLMEESSYLGFLLPLALFVLGAAKLAGTDAVLAVFVAAAVFGQVIPQRDEAQEDKVEDAVNRFFLLPVFVLLGLALPVGRWLELGWVMPPALLAAVLLRRLVTLWLLRPLLRPVHDRSETAFLSWFGPVGVSALFYATLAERLTGHGEIFAWTTLAVTLSVLVHGVSTAPASAWLQRRQAAHHPTRAR